ncbi:glycosyltransferase family 25 protein [Fulvimarina sp. 2208YS6-2-32]|uniref:Glycosyltransferase family 25 protein n=1 Tax=Fulvimarina uroteuthidis TaxID=3098149 RepID=A0ABU5HYC1_9HYPH|nr:glycosyltransferase family 25 protein [Fulvimarina sp. 2208YS6-2-32]MDY8107543.1 glycosyltransferase family 25 protein [Fulvimarina sp. 2208YS6-2-32]
MIAAAYINLSRASERRAFMEGQAERLGLDLARFAAISTDDVDEVRFEALHDRWERPMTRTEVAALLSHAGLWQRAMETNAPIAIFEDDAVLSPRLPDVLAGTLPAFDLINLEYFARRKFYRRYASDGVMFDVARDKAGAAAYIISPEGARKALADLDRHAAPADAFLYASGRLDITQMEPALAVQAEILHRNGIDPGIRTVTQIHTPRPPSSARPENWLFGWRRFLTHLRLVPLHLGRGTFYEFRQPRVDLSEFSRDQSAS